MNVERLNPPAQRLRALAWQTKGEVHLLLIHHDLCNDLELPKEVSKLYYNMRLLPHKLVRRRVTQ